MESNLATADSPDPARESMPTAAPCCSGGLLSLCRMLGLSLVAGLVLVGIVMAVFPIFTVPAELMIPFPPEEIAVAREVRKSEVRSQHAMVFLGSLGFLLTLAVGMGEAVARRFSSRVMAGLVAGVVLATVVGGISGFLGQFLTQTIASVTALGPVPLLPLSRTFIVQACMLGLFGMGVAVAVGLVTGGLAAARNNIVSGLMAGILVGFLFPVLSSLVMPDLWTESVIPGAGDVGVADKSLPGLILYVGLIVAALGLLIPLGSRPRTTKARKGAASGER